MLPGVHDLLNFHAQYLPAKLGLTMGPSFKDKMYRVMSRDLLQASGHANTRIANSVGKYLNQAVVAAPKRLRTYSPMRKGAVDGALLDNVLMPFRVFMRTCKHNRGPMVRNQFADRFETLTGRMAAIYDGILMYHKDGELAFKRHMAHREGSQSGEWLRRCPYTFWRIVKGHLVKPFAGGNHEGWAAALITYIIEQYLLRSAVLEAHTEDTFFEECLVCRLYLAIMRRLPLEMLAM
jgi:hypothetical protein